MKSKKAFIPISIAVIIVGVILLSSNSSEKQEELSADSTSVFIDAPLVAQRIQKIHELKGLMELLNQPEKEERIESLNVKYGESFYSIFLKNRIDREKSSRLSNKINSVFDSKEFKAGSPYFVHFEVGELTPDYLSYPINDTTDWMVDFKSEMIREVKKQTTIKIRNLTAEINGSLARTIINLNCSDDLTDKILSIFAWDIDFDDLKDGDRFSLVYEDKLVEGKSIGSRNILAVKFNHVGKDYLAYGFDNGNGVEYFDTKGVNYSHAPLIFDIISSTYSKWRKHPVRQSYRPHLGMDFVAKIGTPIEAIKSGTVIAATYQKANGNYVKLLHDDGILTQYLHLSKIDSSLIVGEYIPRGHKIGEVGNSGLSSGPHLCFRVWQNKIQKDPLTFDFPRREGIKEKNKEAFAAHLTSFENIEEIREEMLTTN